MRVSSAGSHASATNKRDITSVAFLEDLLLKLDQELERTDLVHTEAVRDKLNMRARVKCLNESLQESRSAHADVVKEKQGMEDELARILKEYRQIQTVHEEAKHGLLHTRGQIGTSKAEWDQLEKHTEAVHNEHQTLHNRRSDIHAELCHLRGRLSGQKTQTLILQKELSNRLMEKKRLETECQTQEENVHFLQSKVDQAAQDKQEMQARYTELKKWSKHLEGELGQIDRDRLDLQTKAGSAAHDISRQEGLLSKKTAENAQLQQKLHFLERSNRTLQKKTENVEKQQEKLFHQLCETEMIRQELHSRMGGATIIEPEQFASNADMVFGSGGVVMKPSSPSSPKSPGQQSETGKVASPKVASGGGLTPREKGGRGVTVSFADQEDPFPKARSVSFAGDTHSDTPPKIMLFKRDGDRSEQPLPSTSDQVEVGSDVSSASSSQSRSSVTSSGTEQSSYPSVNEKSKAPPEANRIRLAGGSR